MQVRSQVSAGVVAVGVDLVAADRFGHGLGLHVAGLGQALRARRPSRAAASISKWRRSADRTSEKP